MQPATGAGDELRLAFREAALSPDARAGAERLQALLDAALLEAEWAGARRLARSVQHNAGQQLSIVRGYAELLAERSYEAAERDELLRRIADAAKRLGDLIHAVAQVADHFEGASDVQVLGGEELMLLPGFHAAPNEPNEPDEPDELHQPHVPQAGGERATVLDQPPESLAELRASAAARLLQRV